MCVCVCVCEREREGEKSIDIVVVLCNILTLSLVYKIWEDKINNELCNFKGFWCFNSKKMITFLGTISCTLKYTNDF